MYPEPCFQAYFHFFKIFCELNTMKFFKLSEMPQTTPLPFLLAREHLCATLKTKNIQKTMIFRARTTDPGLREGLGQAGQIWKFKTCYSILVVSRSTKNRSTSKKSPDSGSIAKSHSPKMFIDKKSAGTQRFAASRYSWFSKNPEFSVPWTVCFLPCGTKITVTPSRYNGRDLMLSFLIRTLRILLRF